MDSIILLIHWRTRITVGNGLKYTVMEQWRLLFI